MSAIKLLALDIDGTILTTDKKLTIRTRKAMEEAIAREIKIVLVTGSAQNSLLDRLEKHYPGIFASERMVTGFDVKQGKPHPEPYLMGLKKAGVKAEEAVVIENAPLGVEAAHAAGICCIAVNTGPLPNHVLLEAGADIVLPSMQALADSNLLEK